MALIEINTVFESNPVDLVEHLADLNDWTFERLCEEEITVIQKGMWADHHVSFTWIEQENALHLTCGFDCKVPKARMQDIMALLTLINNHLWLGHFGLWEKEGLVLYRSTLLFGPDADLSPDQCDRMLSVAIEACDRYYQAFQFVIWAGQTPEEALGHALFETAGEA
jgi:hypothetical protein